MANPWKILTNLTASADALFKGNVNLGDSSTDIIKVDGQLSASAGAYISGSSVIETNSSLPALRVTQTGTGPAIFVEDQYSPDNTGFLVDTSGNVGIGYASGTNLFNVAGGYLLNVKNDAYVAGVLRVDSQIQTTNYLKVISSNGYVSASNYSGSSYTASNGYYGRLFGTASYALNADTLDGIDSSQFALKTEMSGAITGALTPYALSQNVSSSFVSYVEATASLARLAAENTFTQNQTISASLFVSGSSYIDVSSSLASLRVTQRGTGPAIIVEDSQNPDSTTFIVDKDGTVGIGYNTGNLPALGYALNVNGSAKFTIGIDANNITVGQVLATSPTAFVSASFVRGGQVSASIGFNGRLYGTSSYALDADTLDGIDSSQFALKTDVTSALGSYVTQNDATASLARLSADNTFTGINSFGVITGSNGFFSGDLRINGTASIGFLNTINQQSINIGDKYIVILSGATDHPSLDGSGLLWGSGGVGPTVGPHGENAYITYDAEHDHLHIYPGLDVSGSITASQASLFTEITASTGFNGRLYGTSSYALDANMLDGIDSSQFALKTDVTSALGTYVSQADATSSLARLNAVNVFTANQTISASLLVSGSSIIQASSSSPALTITQVGSGPSLFVEDSPTPDTSGFLIDTFGSVGIGYASSANLSQKLNVNGGAYFNSSIQIGASTSITNTYITASSYTGSAYTASDGYYGRLFGSSSYALDADKLDGYDSSQFAILSNNNTFTGNQTISASLFVSGASSVKASSSAPAFMITQEGLGASFFVEDSATPDSTGFLIDRNGYVGIGYTTSSVLGFPLSVLGTIYSNALTIGSSATISNSGIVSASLYSGSIFTASNGYYGRLYGTSSYSLDSDKLDGYDSSQFAILANNNTFTGQLTASNGLYVSGDFIAADRKITIANAAVDVGASGPAGIYVGNDVNPLANIYVTGSSPSWHISGSGGIYIAATSSVDMTNIGTNIVTNNEINVENALRNIDTKLGSATTVSTVRSEYDKLRFIQTGSLSTGNAIINLNKNAFINQYKDFITVDIMVRESSVNSWTNDLVSVYLQTGSTYVDVTIDAPGISGGSWEYKLVAVNENTGTLGLIA